MYILYILIALIFISNPVEVRGEYRQNSISPQKIIGSDIFAETERRTLTMQTYEGLILIYGSSAAIEKLSSIIKSKYPLYYDGKRLTNLQILDFIKNLNFDGITKIETFIEPGEKANIPKLRVIELSLREAVMAGYIPDIIDRKLYEAYEIVQMDGTNFFLIGEQKTGFTNLSTCVFVFSSAGGEDTDKIIVDTKDFSSHGIGYNVIAIKDDGNVIGNISFKTYESPENTEAMVEYLRGIPEGTIIAASTRIGVGVFYSGGVAQELGQIGSLLSQTFDPQISSSHAIIGVKGIKSGMAIEAAYPNNNAEAAGFASKQYLKSGMALEHFDKLGVYGIAIRTTEPDDKVYILK